MRTKTGIELSQTQNDSGEITRLLALAGSGDRSSFDRLYALLYRHIHAIARQRMASTDGNLTINTTGLVHESWLRLVDSKALSFNSSRHFYATASRVMRNIIVDAVRARLSAKRGSGLRALTIDGCQIAIEGQAEQLFEIDRQLRLLENHDERLARLIELRFFGGLTEAEAAEALATSVSTVERDWTRARAWFQLHARSELTAREQPGR